VAKFDFVMLLHLYLFIQIR